MSNHATPNLKEFAERLLAHESGLSATKGATGPVAFRVCEKMRLSFSHLMGAAGFRALSARALSLAGREASWLVEMEIGPDGSLQGLAEMEGKLDEKSIVAGETVLVSQILFLMVTFIGSDLTLQLLRDIWPNMDDLNF